MRPFTLLVKPACADCNLRCEYCFYLGNCALYPDHKRHRMPEPVLEQMIQTYMATEQPAYSFGWQGGEPTLMGLDFFRKVTSLQERHGRAGASVANGLQTNATLIDDAWAEHLHRYNFLVGCSLDGPAEIHDRYRLTAAGKPTHADVLRGIRTLERHGVEFNILVLVSRSNVHRAAEVYRYLVDEGFLFHQYIPCVEFGDDGTPLPFAISGEEWGAFLCGIFDAWYPDDIYKVSVRHFDSVLTLLVDGVSNCCTMGKNCCQYFVVEHNGDIYPCDFFVQADRKLGNVMDTSWEDAQACETYRVFGARKAQWNERCAACRHLDLCAADCIKHRAYAGRSPRELSWLCAGWNRFYEHTRTRFDGLAEDIRKRRADEQLAQRQQSLRADPRLASVGRNDPCPCGSGKKFKRCCGR
jgi:uncharacterized protein